MKNTPSGAACPKKKKWYLFDAMSFLKDFMGQHKKMKSNYDESSNLNEEDTNSIFNESIGDFEENNTQLSTVSHTSTIRPNLNPPKKFNETSKKPISKQSAADLVAGPMVDFLKSKTMQKEEEYNSSDINFFKSIIPDMQKLSSKRRRQFKTDVMLSLNRFIDEEEEEHSRTSSVTSTPLPSPASAESYQFTTARTVQVLPGGPGSRKSGEFTNFITYNNDGYTNDGYNNDNNY